VLDATGKPMRDQLGKERVTERDHWFELSFKLKWTDSPEMPAPAPSAAGRSY
jgi:hypothetical protein